jgi:hypothetical protein
MPDIPLYFEAKQVSVMLLTPVTANCAGALTNVTASNVDVVTQATFDRLSFEGDKGLYEYSAAHALVSNYQNGKIDWVARLSALDKAKKVQDLLDLYTAYDLIRIAARAGCPPDGSSGPGKYLVVIGRIANVGTGWQEGKNMTEITIRPVGIAHQWQDTPTI